MKPALAYHYKYGWDAVGALDVGAMLALLAYITPVEQKEDRSYAERLREKVELFDRLKAEESARHDDYQSDKRKQEEFRRLKLLSSK